MKKICIRVDGNEIIATGHVMRCLSVAEQLRKIGGDVVFVVADERPCSMIEEKGFNTYVLHTVWNNMDTETDVFCHYLVSNNISTVLIDSYFVTEDYLTRVSNVARICYIDDMDKFIYPVHTVINYGLQCDRKYESRYIATGYNTTFLLGGAYAPLREEFSYKLYDIQEKVSRVLITTGGTDQLRMTYSLLDTFLSDDLVNRLEYNVIVGRFNEDKDRLKGLADMHPNVKLHENVSNMSYWMRCCDVAISAAGTTKYELAACGTPSICFEVADNQEGACDWEKGGYMLYAGNAYTEQGRCISTCVEQLVRLCEDFDFRKKLSQNMQGLIDGKGAERIAQYLVKMN